MKKLIIMLAIGLSVAGCATKVNNNPGCKNGICSIEKNDTVRKRVNKMKDLPAEVVIEVTPENFDAVVLQAAKPVVVDFYATWCAPCKEMQPLYHELAQENFDWVFVAIDVDKAPGLVAQCGVQAMPTFVVFKNGVKWGQVVGGRKKEQFITELDAIVTATTPVALAAQTDGAKELTKYISEKNVDKIKELIAAGVDANEAMSTPIGDMSPLQTAILSSTTEIIDVLLDAGAVICENFEAMTNKWIEMSAGVVENIRTGFMYAQELERALPEPIKKSENKLEESDIAQKLVVALTNLEELERLIDGGADVDELFSISGIEITPLYVAIVTNNMQAIEMLINAGATLQKEIIAEPNGLKKTTEQAAKDMLLLQDQGIANGHANLAYVMSKKN